MNSRSADKVILTLMSLSRQKLYIRSTYSADRSGLEKAIFILSPDDTISDMNKLVYNDTMWKTVICDDKHNDCITK